MNSFSMKNQTMGEQRNIVFDLGGVLFEPTPDSAPAGGASSIFRPLQEGVTLLEHCYARAQDRGYKLFVCSNLSMRYIEMLEQDFPQIFRVFDGIVTPTVAQAKKPDPKIFRYLLDTYSLIPHHSIFIDDQITNVDAARQVGMIGVCMSDFNELAAALRSHGVEL